MAGEEVSFTNTSDIDPSDPFVTYNWSFDGAAPEQSGDVINDIVPVAHVTFATPDTYTIKLTLTTGSGADQVEYETTRTIVVQ